MTGLQIYKKAFRNLILLVSLMLFLPVNVHAQTTTAPDTPNLIRVTVDHPTSYVLIQWEASKDPEVDLYQLYRMEEGTGTPIFTFDSETFEYYHMTSGLVNLSYSVTAVDTLDGSDSRESLIGTNEHRAIEVSVEHDPCTPANIVNWTGYVGWEGKITGYRIYGGLKGGVMEELKFVNPDTYTYTHSNISNDTSYTYYVEAVNPWTTSASPIVEMQVTYPEEPEVLRIDEVSVLDDHALELRFTADVDGPVNNFRILRRSNEEEPFLEVETIWDSKQSHMNIIDNVSTTEQSYEYLIQSIYNPESCNQDKVISQSNSGNSVLLECNNEGQLVQLNWTPYESYETGLSGYIVQRRSGGGEFIDLVTLGPESTSWQEAIESVINGLQPGEIQYKVLALSNQVNGADPGISASNIKSVSVETSMQVPNAFTPGRSSNYLFKPVFDFAPRDYTMIIYDRGGRKLFETSDPSEGWDGTYKGGNFAMEGVYVYIIQYTDYTNHLESQSGNVTVIYPAQY